MATIRQRVTLPFPAFEDREKAGVELARFVGATPRPDAHVLAVPRGGVPVGEALAKALDAPLDLVFTRKLPIPWSSQAGFGAIALDGTMVLNEPFVERLGLAPGEIDRIAVQVTEELQRRAQEYGAHDLRRLIRGKDVYLVDDGLATGYTTISAAIMIRRQEPRRVTLAVPVSPADSIREVQPYFDRVYCLICQTQPPFAVASYYRRFPDLTADETRAVFSRSSRPNADASGAAE